VKVQLAGSTCEGEILPVGSSLNACYTSLLSLSDPHLSPGHSASTAVSITQGILTSIHLGYRPTSPVVRVIN